MYNILIVEDDVLFATQLEMMLDKMGYPPPLKASTYEGAIRQAKLSNIDLIILDISLGGQKTGFDFFETLANPSIPVIFITSNESEEFYNRAKLIDNSAYLVKPFHAFTLDRTIQSLVSKSNEESIHLDTSKGKLTNINDIMYLEVENTYTYVHLTKQKAVYKKSLSHILQKLPPDLFLQIHKSYVIHLKYLKEIDFDKNIAILKNNVVLPISRRRAVEIKKHFSTLRRL